MQPVAGDQRQKPAISGSDAAKVKLKMIKENDFIELEYTGKIKEEGMVFDTTDEKAAKENGIFQEGMKFRPKVICLGKGQIIKGLDKALAGKELNKEYTIEVSQEDAYGKKDAKLIQLVPTSRFTKQNIQPVPGLQLNIDGMIGVIKTVSGGRTLVDFNHPLSGKDLVYEIKANRIVSDDKEKISSLLSMIMGIEDAEVSITENKAKIVSKQDVPKAIEESLKKKISEFIPGIKDIAFSKPKDAAPAQSKAKKEQEDLNTSSPDDKPGGG
ncbi:peptidylprolyl isomerase [Candidatus Woesearchaeota archaeon]|nr:peptidylprolyl isomerase [Candidatus Woesearchaeota archaeon]